MTWKTRAIGIAATVLTAGGVMLAAAPAASADPPHFHEGDGGLTDYWYCTGAPNCQYNMCDKLLGCTSMPIYTMGPGEPVWAALPFNKEIVLSYSGWYNQPDAQPGNSDWYQELGGGGGGCEPLSQDNPCYQMK